MEERDELLLGGVTFEFKSPQIKDYLLNTLAQPITGSRNVGELKNKLVETMEKLSQLDLFYKCIAKVKPGPKASTAHIDLHLYTDGTFQPKFKCYSVEEGRALAGQF